MQTLQFIAFLAAGGAILLIARAIDPWAIDRIAIYVGLSYAGMALIAATMGLLRS